MVLCCVQSLSSVHVMDSCALLCALTTPPPSHQLELNLSHAFVDTMLTAAAHLYEGVKATRATPSDGAGDVRDKSHDNMLAKLMNDDDDNDAESARVSASNKGNFEDDDDVVDAKAVIGRTQRRERRCVHCVTSRYVCGVQPHSHTLTFA
jgi:hypothetical protein